MIVGSHHEFVHNGVVMEAYQGVHCCDKVSNKAKTALLFLAKKEKERLSNMINGWQTTSDGSPDNMNNNDQCSLNGDSR